MASLDLLKYLSSLDISVNFFTLFCILVCPYLVFIAIIGEVVRSFDGDFSVETYR